MLMKKMKKEGGREALEARMSLNEHLLLNSMHHTQFQQKLCFFFFLDIKNFIIH